MSLRTYQAKRRFDKTREPRGKPRRKAPLRGLSFVVQKHDASHLHYDFRLELDGVLKSWAVPKGPSLDPEDKRLAVEVEDHPIEYASFEGTIPQGQYGGGTVMVWDRGTWEPKDGTDPRADLKKGKLEFELNGDKLKGAWVLVRMHGRSGTKPQWLLRKQQDDAARSGDEFDLLAEKPLSVKTGRSLDEIATGDSPTWNSRPRSTAGGTKSRPHRASGGVVRRTSRQALTVQSAIDPSKLIGAKAAPVPKALDPQLATLVDETPRGDEWIHEVKFDGYRILAFVRDGRATLISRNGKDWTTRFTPIAEGVESLGLSSAVLDGELVALDENGHSHFQLLQTALKSPEKGPTLAYFVFDVPFFEGFNLRACGLSDRRNLLKGVLDRQAKAATVRFSDAIIGHGGDVLREACKLSLEGIVSKRQDAPYESGRTTSWVKSKCTSRQEMVIGGYTEPQNSRQGFGALLLGHYRSGKLIYAGKVGTGFDQDLLQELIRRLRKIEQAKPSFSNPPRGAEARGAHWVRPDLVCEVKFFEWTSDGRMRHPSFVELREDKEPAEVVRETPKPVRAAVRRSPRPSPSTATMSRPRSTKAKVQPAGEDTTLKGVTITHSGRVIYPDVGVTKGELAEYYAGVANWMLPQVAGRPLSVVRCPQGQGSACFYQKNWDKGETVGSHVAAIRLSSTSINCLVLDDPTGLVWLVQRGVLEVHTWGCTEAALDKPDRMVFDLDPAPELPWSAVVRGAKRLRERLNDRGLSSFVKTTGGKGLHVVVFLKAKDPWDRVKAFSRMIADEMVTDYPEEYIATMSKVRRTGRVFIDYLRNSRGATFVAPYSSRARLGATVSMPMAWEDILSKRTRPIIGVREALAWREKHGDPWEATGAGVRLPNFPTSE